MIDSKYDGNDKVPYHYTYYKYDSNNKIVGYSEINASTKPSDVAIDNNKLTYKYDIEGNITEIEYPPALNDSITSIKFEYNEYNWITGIEAEINGEYKKLRDYSYNNDTTINSIKDYTYTSTGTVSGHILKKYTYDEFNRVTSMKYYDSKDLNTVKESYTYTYDKNSNIKSESIINNYPTNSSDKVDEKRLYEYDKLNRLTNSAIVNNKTNKTEYYSYEYDIVGNMTSKANILSDTNKNATVYTYNDLDQLVTSTTSNIVSGEQTSNKTYTYDKNGNNIQEVDSIKNITKEMTYDVDNRLDTYTETEGNITTTQSNTYNGDGQRIQKQEGDNTINYFYQGDKMLYTTNADGNKTSHNFIGFEGNTISTIRYNLSGLEYYVYNKDIKGSTSNIVDNNNNAKISYNYSDFGETEEFGDKDFYNEIAYTGGIYDENTSLYYLNARYYNPEEARFITQDTYRGESNNPNTLHLYAYCANNPINYVDPTGHMVVTSGLEVAGSYGIAMKASVFLAFDKNNYAICINGSVGFDFGTPSSSIAWVTYFYPALSKVSSVGGFSISASCDIDVGFLGIGGSVGITTGITKGSTTPSFSLSKPVKTGISKNKIMRALEGTSAKLRNGIVSVKASSGFGYTHILWTGSLKKIGTYKINKERKALGGAIKIKQTSDKGYRYMTFKVGSTKLRIDKRGKVLIER